MKISINLPDNLLKDLDTYCEEFSYERSELIRTLIRSELYKVGATTDLKKGSELPTVEKPERLKDTGIYRVKTEDNQVVMQVDTPATDKPVEAPKTEHFKGQKEDGYVWEWCQAFDFSHPFVRGELRPCIKVTVVDSDMGNDAYFKGKFFQEKYMCKDCIEKVNGMEGLALKEVEV